MLDFTRDTSHDDGIGEVHLMAVDLSGGGSGDWDPQQPDWRGMIRLTGQNQRPELIIGDPALRHPSTFQNSASNGIVVLQEVGEEAGQGSFIIELYDVAMNDQAEPIALSGIKINDRQNVDPDDPVLLNNMDGHFIVSDCDIQFCGWHGIVGYVVADGNYTIMDGSIVSDNGVDPPLEEEVGFGVVGAGIYFMNLEAYFMEPFFQVLDSEVMRNSWDGIRLKEMMGIGWILRNDVALNQQRGVYYDIRSGAHMGIIQQCHIHDNDWEGIYCEKGPAGVQVAVKIRQNDVLDNCIDIAGHRFGDQQPWLIANITLRGLFQGGGNIDDDFVPNPNMFPEILNNRIRGGYSGIRLARTNGMNGNPDGLPKNVAIKNNIQYRAAYQGLRIEDLDFEFEISEHPSEIHNNVFYENGSEADDADEAGIWISQFVLPPPVGCIQNNILAGNEDFGITFLGGGNPNFPNNGFHNNNDHLQGCDSDPSVGLNAVENPQFVDPAEGVEDFHLLWHSPMINRGNLAAGFNDADYPNGAGVVRDGSRNDIGPYGGPGAADFGYDPYCAVDAAHSNLENAQLPAVGDGLRQWLEDDYYRVFVDVATPDGQIFDVGNPADGVEDGAAYFEFSQYTNWTAEGVLRLNGQQGENDPRNITLAAADGVSWGQLLIDDPDDECRVNGCIIRDALIPLKLSGPAGAGVPTTVEVMRTLIDPAPNAFWGVFVANRIKLDCRNSEIANSAMEAVSFNYNEQFQAGNQSILDNVSVHDAGNSYPGVYVYRSTARIVASHIFHNGRYGVQAALEGNPFIQGDQGPPSRANSIVNNGDIDNHTETFGAEIMLGAGSMDTFDPQIISISHNNLYEVRPDGAQYVRRGRIISNTGSVMDVEVTGNYFGQSLWQDNPPQEPGINFPEGEREFVEAQDFWDPNQFLVLGVIEDNQLQEFKWDATGDNWREPQNGYEEALAAIGEGDLRTATRLLQDFIADSTGSRLAPAAVRLLFRVEFEREVNLDELRGRFQRLARDLGREHRQAAWSARRSAARALYHSERFDEFIAELNSIRGEAPNELEAAYVDMDVVLAEDMAQGDGINAMRSRYQRLGEIRRRIDEIESESFKHRESSVEVQEFELASVYPNPFNAVVHFQLAIPEAGIVEMAFFDIAGREVAKEERWFTAGAHGLVWKADGEPAGTYFLKVTASGQTQTRKIALVK